MTAKAVPDSLPALLETLPSLGPFLQQLSAVLTSSAPPGTIFIHAPSNAALLLPLIQLILAQSAPALSTSRPPSVQELLPKLALVDLTEVHSTRAAFDRALNAFSGWLGHEDEPELGRAWNDGERGVRNWDGRTAGLRVVGKVDRLKRTKAQPSSRPAKRQRRTISDDEESDLEIVHSPTLEEEAEQEQEQETARSRWTLEWDRTPAFAADKDPVGPIRDTLDYLYLSLQKVMSLGKTGKDKEEEGLRRWLLFSHAEMLHDLPAAGNVGGAPKETGLGMTFASAMYRVGQLSGTPVTTVAISKLSWAKAREGMVGLASPTVLQMPMLAGDDVINLLTFRFAQTKPSSDLLDEPTLVSLFRALAEVVWSAFSSAMSEIDELAYLCAKFWPSWVGAVGKSNPPIAADDTARLSALLKPDFTKQLERLAMPRLTLSTCIVEDASGTSSVVLQGFSGSIPSLPTGPSFLPPTSSAVSQFLPSLGAPASSHTLPLTPIKKRALALSADGGKNGLGLASPRKTLSLASDISLSRSLPHLAKWLLLSAFYAAFNPPKTDVRCFVRVDDNIARRGRKARKFVARPGVESKAALRPELGGGKPFALERMLAIFEAITEDEISTTSKSDVLMQVNTLVGLRLLQRLSAQDKLLDGVKLKCKVERETIDALARSVGKTDWAQSLYHVED